MSTVQHTTDNRMTNVELSPALSDWLDHAFGAYAIASAPLRDDDPRLIGLSGAQRAGVLRFDAPDIRGEHYWSTIAAPTLSVPPLEKPSWASGVEFNQEPHDDGFVQIRWLHEGEYGNLAVIIDQYIDLDLTSKIVRQHPLGILIYVTDVTGHKTSVEIDTVALPLLIAGLGEVQDAIKGAGA